MQGALKTNAVIALFLPLIILAVPILDTGFVVAKRLKYRRRSTKPTAGTSTTGWPTSASPSGVPCSTSTAGPLVMAALALALRFVPYSDDHGNFDPFWTAVIAALRPPRPRRQRLPRRGPRDPQAPPDPAPPAGHPAAPGRSPRAAARGGRARRRSRAGDRHFPSDRPRDGRVRGDRAGAPDNIELLASCDKRARTGFTKPFRGLLDIVARCARSAPSRAQFLVMSPPKYVDLIALAAALAVFLLGDLPLLGYAVAAAAWLAPAGDPDARASAGRSRSSPPATARRRWASSPAPPSAASG